MFQVGQYVGEMCRYIMAVPRKPEDSSHHVRIMVGNGLRPSIWKDFIERFKIEHVTEFYGCTEGNVNFSKLFCSRNLQLFLLSYLFLKHNTQYQLCYWTY
jgi:hypothetical protein